ncbi:SGNH/GDSL hydrolase family protein [Actinoplanes sp. GCM10030250]|uniref:SGNH/GDSL hydrolase family protein n=1 Tax=Actinoplanes sp. GCM10030250 TaxID=3273376 RepID=UPI00361490D6
MAAFGRATTRRALLLGGAGAALVAATPGAAGQRDPARQSHTRVGTWATAPTAVEPDKLIVVANQTIRQVVHLSLGGDQPAVRLTNEFGTTAVHLGAARIGLRAGTGASTAVIPGTDRPLTFAGRRTAVLPAGGTLVSDPADLTVPPGADLVISLYFPERTRLETASPRSFQTTVVAKGNVTALRDIVHLDPASISLGLRRRYGRYFLLAGVDVRTSRNSAAIAALGDSITCGVGSRTNTNHRWPDLLATRLRLAGQERTDMGGTDLGGADLGGTDVSGADLGGADVSGADVSDAGLELGVLNLGISGNRLLTGYERPTGRPVAKRAGHSAHIGPSALSRFDRDVLAHSGVRHLITLIGVNDLGRSAGTTAEDLIAGHRELAARAHKAGLRVIGGTMLPFGGAPAHFDSRANQIERVRFNTWLRTTGAFDAVADFDAVIRDPARPRRMLPAYDSGDHLHPSDAGMAALATAVPLDLFT